MYGNVFFLLLFLERAYLPYYVHYILETLCTYWNIVMEGTVSQIFHTAPDSFFIKCRKKIPKKNQKVTLFLHKIQTRIKRKNLRNSSLNTDVVYMYAKFKISKFIVYLDMYF